MWGTAEELPLRAVYFRKAPVELTLSSNWHCQILSPDKTEWQLISATLCGWRRCFVADQLWFVTCIREEELTSNVAAHCFRDICSQIAKIGFWEAKNGSPEHISWSSIWWPLKVSKPKAEIIYLYDISTITKNFAPIGVTIAEICPRTKNTHTHQIYM